MEKEKSTYRIKMEFAEAGLLILVYSGICFLLFERQAMNCYANSLVGHGPYYSDLLAYLQEAMDLESGYTFAYPVFFNLIRFLSLFLPVETAGALVTTLFSGGSLLLLACYLGRWMKKGHGPGLRVVFGEKGIPEKGSVLVPVLLSLSLHLVSMLYLPRGQWHLGLSLRYIGVFTPNPYHNATYLAVRCISIPAFFLFLELLEEYEGERFPWKKSLWFGFWLMMTALTKPSFTLVMVAACGLWMGWRLIRDRFGNLVGTLKLTLSFLPTFGILLYQFFGTFGGERADKGNVVSSLYRTLTGIQASSADLGTLVADRYPQYAGSGMGVGFLDAWKMVCGNIPAALLLAGAFPLALVGFALLERWAGRRAGREAWPPSDRILLEFSTLFYASGLGLFVFFYEKGERFIHLNFSWGYMHGLFALFTGGLCLLAKGTLKHKLSRFCLWGLYALHLVCGICYFAFLLTGGNYQDF